MENISYILFIYFLIGSTSIVKALAEDNTLSFNISQTPLDCCSFPSLGSVSIINDCIAEYNTSDTPLSCVMACAFNTTNFTTPDGSINITSIENVLTTNMMNQTDFADLFIKSFRICEPRAKSKLEEEVFNGLRINKNSCSPFAALLMQCVHFEVFMNCPSNNWSYTPDCDDVRLRSVFYVLQQSGIM